MIELTKMQLVKASFTVIPATHFMPTEIGTDISFHELCQYNRLKRCGVEGLHQCEFEQNSIYVYRI